MAKFLALLYTYLNISISKNIVPDEIKGREILHSFPMTLFQVEFLTLLSLILIMEDELTWAFDIHAFLKLWHVLFLKIILCCLVHSHKPNTLST